MALVFTMEIFMRLFLLGVTGIILLSGCATRPSITYKQILKDTSVNDVDVSDTYYLNASLIRISPIESTSKTSVPDYSVVATPVEYQAFKVAVIPSNNIFKTTKLNITKADNSDRYAVGGTETTDNIKSLISSIGGVVAKGIAAAAPSAGTTYSCALDIKKQYTIDITPYLTEDAVINQKILLIPEDSKTQCITINVDPRPIDSRPMEDYPWGKKTSSYYYSACRNATIKITQPDKQEVTKSIRIADPNFFQSVQYPFKGSITMHSQCGVSVKTDQMANPLGGLDILDELLKQVKAISDAK
jgi:hypothetical protein